MSEFYNAALNKDYILKSKADVVVHTPEGYTGKLSGIPSTAILDAMIKRGTNLVAKRETIPEPATKPAPITAQTKTPDSAGDKSDKNP